MIYSEKSVVISSAHQVSNKTMKHTSSGMQLDCPAPKAVQCQYALHEIRMTPSAQDLLPVCGHTTLNPSKETHTGVKHCCDCSVSRSLTAMRNGKDVRIMP